MMKTFTAGLMALSLTLIPAAPVQAQNNQTEMQRTILGLLAVGGIALAIKNQQDRERKSRSSQENRVQVHDRHSRQGQSGQSHRRVEQGWGQSNRRQVDLVPGRCFRRVELANGRHQGVFGARCLERRYRDASTLPRQCQIRVGGQGGNRRGYDARCLRDFGYRSDRRWN